MKFKTSEKLRKYKREYMRKRRSDPVVSKRIRLVTNKWYASSGRKERQKEYIEKMKIERFFHWRARLFNMHYKTKFDENDLRKIWDKQNGKCYFTGYDLDKTSHIDHIVPIKRGGNSDISNLRWVTKSVNHMKRDLLDEEFIIIIKAIMEKILCIN